MSSADSISIRVLGGVRVEGTDGTLTPRQQTLLGVLAVRRRSVSADTLVDVLWPDEPPANPRSALQVHVSRLRRILESVGATIHRDGDSYALQVERHRLDLAEFERLAGEGTALIGADPANGIAVLNRALELWQVDPPPILRDSLELRGELSRLNELRSSALETRIAAEIELGRTGEAIVELRRLVDENPVREQLTRLLMLALSSLGRVSEALDSYDRLGRSLAEELGIEPGTEIEELRSNLVGRATEAETTEDAQTARERHSRVVSARAALERPAADDVARGLEYVELASALRDETGSSGETAAAVARALELI
ncbi:MAG TPA: AfsR/SARP family transcriptional regulator, partial [Terrimesophilobacter sp.]|nr:AfsR/SARP family transcriptional regulator [Terrimesophilobacter sp.]